MTEAPQTESSPIPQPDERSVRYWDALSRGELLLQRCAVCEALNHPATSSCRVCDSTALGWAEVAPHGRLFSWAIEGRGVIPGMQPPYVIAQVTPDECADGTVRLACTLLTDDPSCLEIDMPVRLVARPAPGSTVALAHFTPS